MWLLDHEEGHAAGQDVPYIARKLVLDLVDGHAQLEQLLHAVVEAGPQVAALVLAGVQEGAAGLELVRQLVQQRFDLGLVALHAVGVELDRLGDAFGRDVVAGVLAVLEQAVEEDRFDPRGVKNEGGHCVSPLFEGLMGVTTLQYITECLGDTL